MSFQQVFVEGVKVSFWKNCFQEVAVKGTCYVCLQKQSFLNV